MNSFNGAHTRFRQFEIDHMNKSGTKDSSNNK